MATDEANEQVAIEALPALIGECFRGADEEGVGGLSYALRDEGLYIKCTHVQPHEVKIA